MQRLVLSRRAKILGGIGAAICLVTLTCAFVVLVIYAANLSGRITAQQARITAQAESSNHNRVLNVLTWCHAINGVSSETRAYVEAAHAKNPAIPVLVLPTLPCQQIAHRTALSTH
jgi:hypothetical protein